MTKVSARFERISVDIAGPFAKTQRNNTFVLVGICCFSKFGFAFATPSIESPTLARLMLDRYFMFFGFPVEIHSDAGLNFISEMIKQFYKLLGIKQSNNLAWVPQQNGASERFIQSLKGMVCHYAEAKPRSWDLMLSPCVLAYGHVHK